MTRAKPVGAAAAAAGDVRQKFVFEMQMRWWASQLSSLWGGSPLPSPPQPPTPRSLELPGKTMSQRGCLNHTPTGTSRPLVCGAHRVADAGAFPKRMRAGARGREGAQGLGRAPESPDSQVVNTGHRRSRWAGAEEREPGWARRSQAHTVLLAPISWHL